MYGRTLGDRVLEFGHEGILYRNSFVMYDRQTRSLWVHTTGQAVKGELRGEKLHFLPSDVVTWQAWADAHPETLVLDRGGEDTSFMGTFSLPDETDAFGISVGSGTSATLYPYDLLSEAGLMQHGDQVVVLLAASGAARAYSRGSRDFRLEDGHLTDGTGARWEASTGRSRTAGGEDLVRLPSTAWLTERWTGFYGDGVVVGR